MSKQASEEENKELNRLEIIHTTYKEMIKENNYISKDKIREKIKELSKTQAFKVGLENYTIRILEELLEEK